MENSDKITTRAYKFYKDNFSFDKSYAAYDRIYKMLINVWRWEFIKSDYRLDTKVNYFFSLYLFTKIINLLKQKVKNCYIPEEETSAEFQKPILVTALGKLTKFNILINNGVSHMLSFSQNKNFIFFNEQSEKWKPANDHTYVYDCKVNNTKIDKLSSDTIIEILEKN